MHTILYNLSGKFLSTNTRAKAKFYIHKIRIRNRTLLKYIYGTVNDEELFRHIEPKIGKDADILFIHSSFNNMIPNYVGKVGVFIEKIISYCEKNCITLAMPTFYFGKTNSESGEYFRDHVFNVNRTVSKMGILTEIFRRKEGVKRSIHPTHSVCAYGPLADKLTATHHLGDTACGEGTPFGEMTKYKTIILGIGIRSFRALTQVHSAEDLMKSDFPFTFNYSEVIPVTCLDKDKNTITYHLTIKKIDYRRDARMLHTILGKEKLKEWKYKGMPFFLTQAKLVTDALIDAAKKGQTIYKRI